MLLGLSLDLALTLARAHSGEHSLTACVGEQPHEYPAEQEQGKSKSSL
jgi:hypothetical protein